MARQRKLPVGMMLRGKVYYANFKSRGLFVRQRLSSDFNAACEELNKLRVKCDKGEFGKADDRYPWEKLKAEFLGHVRQTLRRPQEYEADLRRFESFAPIVTVAELDHERAVAYRTWRLDAGVTPRSVNRELSTIRNMLNKGVKWGRLTHNPLAGLEPLAHDHLSKERRALTFDEVVRLFEASPAYLRPMRRMFASTGLRRREVVELVFDDVDFRQRTINVRRALAKSRKTREVPLDDELLATIERLRDEAKHRQPVAGKTAALTAQQAARFSREHVFVTKANTPWKNNLLERFYAICRKAGIEGAEPNGDVDIHSLRVTFTTLSLDGGAAPKAVQAILGHSTLDLTMKVYARATDPSKRAAVNALGFANASPPEHLIPVQKVPTGYARNSAALQAKSK